MNSFQIRYSIGKIVESLVKLRFLRLTAVFLFSVGCVSHAVGNEAQSRIEDIQIKRLANNPIIRPQMLSGKEGQNINGPSLIRVPDWVTNRLGNYYLYFANHGGGYIRMAYADKLEGPWKIQQGGVLQLKDAPACKGHIASPDAIIDEARREIRLYFHAPASKSGHQKSYVALSKDGLKFDPRPEILGEFYFRVFRWNDMWYAMAKAGQLYRSKDGLTEFKEGLNPLDELDDAAPGKKKSNARHVALKLTGDLLWVYYTSLGDAPERIYCTQIRLTADWNDWKPSAPQEILRPETEWEGASLPLAKSNAGAARGRENALRDPCIFTDRDGRDYLLYSVAGESGIAIAEILYSAKTKGKP